MRFNIRYVAPDGLEEIDFTKPPYNYKTHDFIDYEHKYELVDKYTGGSFISAHLNVSKVYSMKINVFGEDMHESINKLTDTFDYSIAKNKMGRLYVNEHYIDCYIVASKKSDWEKHGNGVVIDLSILTLMDKWYKEVEYNLYKTDGQESEVDGFILPMEFPTHFAATEENIDIDNDSVFSGYIEITMYGPVRNPLINIGGRPFGVNIELLDNERVVIDQKRKRVTKITPQGYEINVFNQRQKFPSVFDPIPSGYSRVEYTQDFGVTIKVFEERSEPKWI